MKGLITLLLLLFINNLSFAQSGPASQEFIKSVIPEKKVFYIDSLGKYDMSNIVTAFNREGKYKDAHKYFQRIDTPSMNIILTADERAYVGLELYNMKSYVWDDNLLEKWKLVPTDTVNKIFGDRRHDGWSYFYAHYGPKLYSFSKPIFLRNGTMCLFYSSYSCGGTCGEGNFSVYLKINDEWRQVCILWQWIS